MSTSKSLSDHEVILKTGEEGFATAKTEVLNGFLEALFVSSDSPVQVRINTDNYIIFELKNFVGRECFLVRSRTMASQNEEWNFNPTKYPLNDIITVIAEGIAAEVKIIIRVSHG